MAAAEREWNYAVESVKAAAYAEQEGIFLAVEPTNRYETFLINNGDQGLRFVSDVWLRATKLHLDTFHTNMEEKDPAEAIRKAGEVFVSVHIADSNRDAEGYGHTDFEETMRAFASTRKRYRTPCHKLRSECPRWFTGFHGARDA